MCKLRPPIRRRDGPTSLSRVWCQSYHAADGRSRCGYSVAATHGPRARRSGVGVGGGGDRCCRRRHPGPATAAFVLRRDPRTVPNATRPRVPDCPRVSPPRPEPACLGRTVPARLRRRGRRHEVVKGTGPRVARAHWQVRVDAEEPVGRRDRARVLELLGGRGHLHAGRRLARAPPCPLRATGCA